MFPAEAIPSNTSASVNPATARELVLTFHLVTQPQVPREDSGIFYEAIKHPVNRQYVII